MDAISDTAVRGLVNDLRRAAILVEHLASRAAFWERDSMNAHMGANRLGNERDDARNALAEKIKEVEKLERLLSECEADLDSECAAKTGVK